MVNEGLLGCDWQTRKELEKIKEKTINQIKELELEMQNSDVVK